MQHDLCNMCFVYSVVFKYWKGIHTNKYTPQKNTELNMGQNFHLTVRCCSSHGPLTVLNIVIFSNPRNQYPCIAYFCDDRWPLTLINNPHLSIVRHTLRPGDHTLMCHCSIWRITALSGDSLLYLEIHCSIWRFTALSGDSLLYLEITHPMLQNA